MFKKKPGMSDEKFNEYWAHIHGPLCIELMQKYGIIRNAQLHVNNAKMQFIKEHTPAFQLSEWDGVEDFYVRDLKNFTDLLSDEEYKSILAPDAQRFVGGPEMALLVGEDYVLLDNGKVQEQHENNYHCS
ncbi:hypothetical protein TWF481_004983 [Arthrobotrys musiformis]|uniref:EthD domain-containing protein n=1 Tax=Arthrobotrys musiformis TaxID=47236 RepID=A0AAV9WL54_9PEZI